MAVFLSGAQNLTGASHDSLDVAKMGGSRIRRLDKVGVLGRGGRGWKEGRRGKLQRWADMALQVTRVSGELDREGVRKRGGGGGLAATAATAKKFAKKNCQNMNGLDITSIKLYAVVHNCLLFINFCSGFIKHAVGWIFPNRVFF